jgi:hypothetical protein
MNTIYLFLNSIQENKHEQGKAFIRILSLEIPTHDGYQGYQQ